MQEIEEFLKENHRNWDKGELPLNLWAEMAELNEAECGLPIISIRSFFSKDGTAKELVISEEGMTEIDDEEE